MLDVFNRAVDTSYPIISTTFLKRRLQKRKRSTLPPEVIELLCSCETIKEFEPGNEDVEINECEESLYDLNLENELDLIKY